MGDLFPPINLGGVELTINKNQELKDWDSLYQYVKKEIMKYGDDMKLPKYMVLRLKGLNKGQFIANKSQKTYANYSFNIILLTFKACKQDILKYTSQNIFKDEKHRFNYIMTIIENNINEIVLRLDNKKNQEEKIENLKIDNIQDNKSAKYTKKTKEIQNDRLNELW